MSEPESTADDVVRVELEWEFASLRYFEEPFILRVIGYDLHFDEEKVWCHLPPDTELGHGGVVDELTERIRTVFKLAEVEMQEKVEIPEPRIGRRLASGRLSRTVRLSYAVATGRGYSPTIIPGGREAYERWKEEQRQRKRRLARVAATYGYDDPVLRRALASFYAALRDSADEFIHLYDIREAVKTFFGGEREVREALSITKSEWNEFGRLSNDAPIRQGRHRGKHYDALRDATDDERRRAREFIRLLVEKYIGWLEAQKGTGVEPEPS